MARHDAGHIRKVREAADPFRIGPEFADARASSVPAF
jgi:hypothetical protein